MKKLFLIMVLLFPVSPLVSSANAAPGPGPSPGPSPGPTSGNWEIRRLGDGTCGVKKVKPGAKPGNRIGGPYVSEAKARTNLNKLKLTPSCRRF